APKEKVKRPSFRGIHVFVSGSTWNWYRPIYAGDKLYSFGGTESVVEKRSEFAERSLLITYVSVKMNQRAEIVAISRTLAIHTERKTAREKGKYSDIQPASYTDEDIAKIAGGVVAGLHPARSGRRGDLDRTYGSAEFCEEFLDDVVVGDDMVIGTVNDGWVV